ncbi:MAG: hypothetical protein OIF57_17770 [Marinobacterium sp.]|nr:hypothetical protein [Marinobacterium sp.]
MKAYKIAPLALAVSALTFANIASADGERGYRDGAHIKKRVTVSLDMTNTGTVGVGGYVGIDRLGMAVVDDKQSSTGNQGYNEAFSNTSDMGDGALRNASGNIGVNVAAGDNNVQGNSAALAASDAGFVFGEGEGEDGYSHGSSADAEIFVHQTTYYNYTYNYAQRNKASMGNNALQGASGNIGVNIASGNNNVQKNALAGSVGYGAMSVATINVQQHAHDNYTDNLPISETREDTIDISLAPDGETGLYFQLPDGSYTGWSEQANDAYPDVWTGTDHPAGDQIGHVDLDGDVQGAVDMNDDGEFGALGFDEGGTLDFSEADPVQLMGSLSGTAVIQTQVINERGWNRSTMGDSALANASGNIGVNIATGTNNLQNNSLAIAALRGPDVGDMGNGGEGMPPMPGTGGGAGGETP